MTANRNNFGHDTTTDEVLDGMDLTGRRVFVTGGASGLGKETARALAAKGAQVTIAARTLAAGEAAAGEIRQASGSGAVDVVELELGSLASIRRCADEFLKRTDRIDLLINNAGVMACPQDKTEDGFETQFGVNHIGHFLLTNLLMPAVLNGEQARIVSLSSRGHMMDTVHFDDPNYEHRAYNNWLAYGQSKTANVLFAVGLNRRLASRGISVNAVHPGVIMTNLSRHMTAEDMEFLQERARKSGLGEMRMKSVEAGAATSVYTATAVELSGIGGRYLEDCGLTEINDSADSPEGVRSYAVDPENAERLWTLSEQLIGESFSP